MTYSGMLNIVKPAGMTSFEVVARVKELTGERRAGHAGTLDPDATGVLPVALGQATRLIEFLADSTKVYRTEIGLGITTDTYDASGSVIFHKDSSGISEGMVKTALASFLGVIQQVPPMYSALRHNGKRLYELARAGISIERKRREVHIYRVDLVNYTNPFLTIEVECGKGTYIRSIASDLGEALGCGAYMKGLTRLKVGPFGIEDGISLADLEEACRYGFFSRYIYAPDTVLLQHDAAVINWGKEDSVKHGQRVGLETKMPFSSGVLLRTYSLDGRFIGILRYDASTNRWQPQKVFTL